MTAIGIRTLITFIIATCVLLGAPGMAQAQEGDHPLVAPPGSNGPGTEPQRLIGNYCGAFGGVSLHDEAERTFDVMVPGKPVTAYIYWSGRDRQGAPGDDTLLVSNNGGAVREITATVGTVANSDSNYSWFTYSYAALQGPTPLIVSGMNQLRVSGLETAERHGVGALVIYEDENACPYQQIDLFFGNDVLFKGWNGPSGPHSEVTCVDFPAPPEPIEIDIQMFVGGIENELRSDSIWHATGAGPKPVNLIDAPYATALDEQLAGLSGNEFDNYDTFVQDPQPIIVDAGDTWACFQIESPEPPNPGKSKGISATWINLAVRTPLANIGISPDGFNPLNEPHIFTVTVESSIGFDALTITPTVEPAPLLMEHTCDTPVIDGAIATCSITINSDVPGIFEATVGATIYRGDMVAEIVTNGRGNNSEPAVKEYYVPAAIGDHVFGDSNPDGATPEEIMAGNGIQDEGEQGVDGIVVQLYDAENNLIAETITVDGGYYEFLDLPPGEYYVVFINPLDDGIWTIANVGDDDTVDSDVDPFLDLTVDPGVEGDAVRTELIQLEQGEFDRSWDAGLVGLSTLASSALGDRIWLDVDEDGLQGDTMVETGLAGISVRLYRVRVDRSLALVNEMQTGENGEYFFDALDPGSYLVEFLLPQNYTRSPLNVGRDRSKDSDAALDDGRTVQITLPAHFIDRTWDAGVFQTPTAIDTGDEPATPLDNHVYLPVIVMN